MFKATLISLSTLALLLFSPASSHAAQPIDTQASKVEWFASKVTGSHNGTVALKSGSVDVSRKSIKAARFVFDMSQIVVLDIESPKWNAKLTDHLKSTDFFNVSEYPEAVFELQEAKAIRGAKAGEPNYRFTGDLTIKGITHAISFDAQVDLGRKASRAQGKIVVDRTKYGITYKSSSVFKSIGDQAIHDDFTITFDVVTES